jgi:hypothetical protein
MLWGLKALGQVLLFACFKIMGSGLAFCLFQKSHINALKFHYKDESDTGISYLQVEILPCSPAHL